MLSLTFNPLAIANAMLFIGTLAVVPMAAIISSEVCAKCTLLIALGHTASAASTFVVDQTSFAGSFLKVPIVVGTWVLLWDIIPSGVVEVFLFALTTASPILLSIEAAQITRLSIRTGSQVLHIVDSAIPTVKMFFVFLSGLAYSVAAWVVFSLYQEPSIDVVNASIISSVTTIMVILTIYVIMHQEGSIIDTSLLAVYLSFVGWSSVQAFEPPPESLDIYNVFEWVGYLVSVLSFSKVARIAFRIFTTLSLSVNLHNNENDDDDDEDDDDVVAIGDKAQVTRRGWSNGIVSALCLCLYTHVILQVFDHHAYSVAAWGPGRVLQCVVVVSLYVYTVFLHDDATGSD